MKVKTVPNLQELCLSTFRRRLYFCGEFYDKIRDLYREKYRLPLHIPVFFRLHCIILDAFMFWLDENSWIWRLNEARATYWEAFSYRYRSIQKFYYYNDATRKERRAGNCLPLYFLIQQGIITQECVKRVLHKYFDDFTIILPPCLVKTERNRKKYLYDKNNDYFCFKTWFASEKEKSFDVLYEHPPKERQWRKCGLEQERCGFYKSLYSDYDENYDNSDFCQFLDHEFQIFVRSAKRDVDLCERWRNPHLRIYSPLHN